MRFVTTSAGDPTKYTAMLKEAGLTVFHVVPSLRGALKAVGAGVDGLVVEGNEGGGFKHPSGASTMVLLPLVCSKVDVPVIAAGGIVDGRSMAASFVLGAEGVQMGTRMLSAAESPVHDQLQAVGRRLDRERHRAAQPVRAARRSGCCARRAAASSSGGARCRSASSAACSTSTSAGTSRPRSRFGGQVAGRIDGVRPVADILNETISELHDVLAGMARAYPRAGRRLTAPGVAVARAGR